MIAIDTNLVVRYLTGDHPEQAAKARALIDGNEVFIGMTVLLETEWVLRSVYGYATSSITKALRGFAGLPHVTLENPGTATQAFDWADAGLDFADALHLAKVADCDSFATFDARFARAANKLGPIKVRVL